MLPKTKKLGISAIIAVVGLVMISMTGLNSNNNLIAVHQPAFAQLHKNQTLPEVIPQIYEWGKFTAKLAGNNEVPPVTTPATGTAHFHLMSWGRNYPIFFMLYNLSTTNLKGITMANIHLGKAGENGQPVASLSKVKGSIGYGDLKGPLAYKFVTDLANIMRNGSAYVNVHTQQNQNGELRGQIMPG